MALVTGLMLATSVAIHAQERIPWTHGGPLLPDSSNFVTASLLVASPGKAIYSQLGHAAIRMECPIHNLDYCFSFEEEAGMGGIVKFFVGKTDAHMMAVPTAEFLEGFKRDGRQMKQYTLNLTTHEMQELWRLLDNDYVDEELRHFNYMQNNCSSVSLQAVENVVVDEEIDFKGWPKQFKMNNGQLMRYYVRDWPWLEFWCSSFGGTESDVTWENEQRICPEIIVPILKKASLVSPDGSKRSMMTGEKELLPLVTEFKASPIQSEFRIDTDENGSLHADSCRARAASEDRAPRKLDDLAEIAVIFHRTGRKPDVFAVGCRLESMHHKPSVKIAEPRLVH